MLDHIGLAVRDIDASRAFYEQALAALGYGVVAVIPPEQMESGGRAVMFGVDGEPDFVIADNERPGEGTHVAFRASTRAQVEAFHATAIAAGGRDNGKPGLRPEYGPNYYAAFVFDPDGINVEAVCHAIE
ncbi:VOC family protein [Brevundimonas sp.]|uniref:VOC family protein n=1 Tax=Brevundimonas sp. TaxID=1871086 RepID=UPI0017E40F5B|nr:VOC family protein [Brevundimonas sp.]MBA4808407.1 VOC family protein [Brevundimonas sp.]